MEEFAKVEKLVDITGASFEDARNALRACDGEMVESMVYLEKLGKVTKYRSNNSIDPRFAPISDAEIEAAAARKEEALRRAAMDKRVIKAERKAEKRAEKEAVRSIRREYRRSSHDGFFSRLFRFLVNNSIVISKEGQEFASIPLLVVLILLNISVGFAFVVAVVSMMCGYEYSFRGESEAEAADTGYDRYIS